MCDILQQMLETLESSSFKELHTKKIQGRSYLQHYYYPNQQQKQGFTWGKKTMILSVPAEEEQEELTYEQYHKLILKLRENGYITKTLKKKFMENLTSIQELKLDSPSAAITQQELLNNSLLQYQYILDGETSCETRSISPSI